MPSWNATLELTTPARQVAGTRADRILANLADYHPVVTASASGRAQLIITLPAPDLPTAALRAHRLTADLPITRSTIESTTSFDNNPGASNG